MPYLLTSGRQWLLGLAILTSTALVAARSVPPEPKPLKPMNAEQPHTEAGLETYELTSSLKVNGRRLGPQKIRVSGRKTHIAVFRESATRQYQVTYQITTSPANDTVNVSTSVTATVFSPSFQLMDGQQTSARQTPDLPEIEVIVSARKLPVAPHSKPHKPEKAKVTH